MKKALEEKTEYQKLADEGDFVGSFESFLKDKHKDICMTCWGHGKLKFTGHFMTYPVTCKDCNGTGRIGGPQ